MKWINQMIHCHILFIEEHHFIFQMLIKIFQIYLHGSNISVYATNLDLLDVNYKGGIGNKLYFLEDGQYDFNRMVWKKSIL